MEKEPLKGNVWRCYYCLKKSLRVLTHYRNIYSFTALLQKNLMLPYLIYFRLGRINLIKGWCFPFTRRKHVFALKIITNIHGFKNKPMCISTSSESNKWLQLEQPYQDTAKGNKGGQN